MCEAFIYPVAMILMALVVLYIIYLFAKCMGILGKDKSEYYYSPDLIYAALTPQERNVAVYWGKTYPDLYTTHMNDFLNNTSEHPDLIDKIY